MSFRAFISVDLDRFEAIQDYIEGLKTIDPTLKVVDPAQVHLTLKFLGDTDEDLVPKIKDAMYGSVQGIKPFGLKLVGSSSFPSLNRIRVVWVGLEGVMDLGTIASRLDESLASLGIERKQDLFAPHVTVARAKVEAPNPGLRGLIEGRSNVEFGEQIVKCIRLKKSVLTKCGPKYSTVEEVPLNE